ncbi:hypothetical protein [Actinomadura alba]|uniref:hypothetical protein n=1 Tax=Actinomadura alba TaxID=406431 RepID=UPI001C9C5772|nr:hypothetical protein [Actinomadura alba]
MRTINRTHIALLSALGVAAIAVSGCGSDEPDVIAGLESSAPAPAAPGTTDQGAPDAGGGGGPVTSPGTALRIGQRAVVPFKYGSKTGTIAITVTAIEQGDQAAFSARFGARANGMVPYYIRYSIENVGGTDLSSSSAPLLRAIGPDGRSTGVGVIGDLPACERGRATDQFTSAGAKYEACRLQAARQGGEVAGAEYDESEGGYRDSPIVWKK